MIHRALFAAVLVFGLGSSVEARAPRQNVEYSVPVDSGLSSSAIYTVDLKWRSLVAGQRELDYDLPIELDGVGQEISLVEVSPGHFKGPKAEARCQFSAGFMCEIEYQNLVEDKQAATAAIRRRFSDPAEIQRRLAVTDKFLSDPISRGVLRSTSFPGAP